ncbi:F0F1 ATP synthase subunit delta [Aerophototrophica crusticola]|uniref:ATP synthase subunit delta n=1 Tax=Aerophototrophica crusticola TaxID=1709002 RepID=A0A858R8P7_9PROT|nr:F0F1 ATP synthase subunit delta [Rhodospirillaceae bacterium B3]
MATEGTGVSGLAARYATAMFDLADDQKVLDQTAQDLTLLKQMLAESPDLRRLVGSPLLARADQARAMDAVLASAGISGLVRKFVGLVAQNRRLFALSGMIDGFLAELARRRGEQTAQVTVARPLSPEQLDAVSDALKRALGAKMAVSVRVDPALIGGMIVKVGSRMIDSSVRTKLTKLKLAMKGVG